MFEFVPFLKGLYLTYAEYFALVVGSFMMAVAIVTYLIGKICYSRAKVQKKFKVQMGHIEISSFRDVVRVLGAIFTSISAFSFCFAVTSVSAFRVIPTWWSMVINFVALLIAYGHLLVKMDDQMKDFTLAQGWRSISKFRQVKLQRFFILILIVLSVGLPAFFEETCVCIYEEHREYSVPLPSFIPAAINTKFLRQFMVEQACDHKNAPCHVYATLPEESSTGVFINVHTHTSQVNPLTMTATEGKNKLVFTSTVYIFTDLESRANRNVHTFYLHGLKPSTLYSLSLTIGKTNYPYKYKTLASHYSDAAPIKIISGGDIGNTKAAKEIWQQISYKNPDAILLGGDLAYDNNIKGCYFTWDLLLNDVDRMNQFVGRIIPMILAIGNHDAGLNPYSSRQLTLQDNSAHPMFFSYFPQGELKPISQRQTYFATKLGQAVLFTLDSGYLVDYAQQAQYIDHYLTHNQPERKFAQYHHPIYSSLKDRTYEGINFQQGSLYFVSRFDRFHFSTVYENHQHAHKRTKLLKNHLESPDGTLYLGDGSWGADINFREWNQHDYLAKSLRVNSVWMAEIGQNGIKHQAISNEGTIVDEFHQN